MIEVEWARLKAHELRAMANNNSVVILPIASIEQHGPHLPVMTDMRLGQEIAHRAARKSYPKRPTVVTPVVWSGLSEHHMAFGGTLTLSHDTFRRVMADLIEAIIRQGFRDILISNSHGGNIIPMQQILDELSPRSRATLVATTYVMEAGTNLSQYLEDQESIMHACEGETSMMLVCEPDLVDIENLNELASTKQDKNFLTAGKSSYRWRQFMHMTQNGVAGNPSRSNSEKGAKMLEAGASALSNLIVDPKTWVAANDLRSKETGGIPFNH